MLRRKTFIYALALVVGMASGFLMFECDRYLVCGILIAFYVAVIFYIDLECDAEKMDKARIVILLFLIAGLILFACKYFQMNADLTDESGKVIPMDSTVTVECVVKSIEHREDSYKLVVKPRGINGCKSIQISYYGELKYERDIYEYLGARIRVNGKIGKAAAADNPGCFNYRNYLYGKNISHTLNAKSIEPICENNSLFCENNSKCENNITICENNVPGCEDNVSICENNCLIWKYRRYIARLRDEYISQFESDEIRAFIKGVIFGDKTDIDEETLEEFNQNSTGHILAVSGLHVGFLFVLLRILTRKKKSVFITMLIILILLFYAEMTGWSASTSRAVIVMGISLISIYARRPADLLTSVSVAAIIILVVNPYQLVSSGFQMSMLALLSISFISKPLSYFVGDYFGSLLAIQIGMLPIVAFTFNGFNPLSILINIPIVFLSSLLVPMCIVGLMIMAVFAEMPEIFADAISLFSELLIKINECLNFGGAFYFDAVAWNVGVIVAFYSAAFFISSEWAKIKILRKEGKTVRKMAVLILIPTLLVGIATWNPYLSDEVVFVSVGQGDAVHIRADGHNVLIDGGGNKEYNVGKKILKPYLLKNGVGNLDMALVTHLHTDHYQGIKELDEVYPIGEICMPNELSCGDKVSISNDTYIEVIWPLGKVEMNAENANEDNMVYIVYCKNRKYLITGDLLEADEKRMVEHYRGTDKLKCDVLKVAHHGSKSSTCEEFLDAVRPELAVISVGRNNMYGHPHQQTLDRLEKRGIKVCRTDLNGAVGIKGDGPGGNFFTKRGRTLNVDTMR